MSVTAETRGETGLVTLTGKFTFECHLEVKAATDPLLADPAVKRIHLDLAGVDHMDASCLGMLLILREKAEAKGQELALLALSPTAKRLLESAQFMSLFRIAK
jgi:anti-anti-sigma factor